MHPFPQINPPFKSSPEEGIVTIVPIFCQRHFNSKCTSFYKKISNQVGFFTCPYGFTAYLANNSNQIITCLNIKGCSVKKKIQKHENKNESISLITKTDFYRIVAKFNFFSSAYILEKNVNRENNQVVKKATFNSKLITNTLHELRKLNKQIKVQSEYLREYIDSIDHEGIKCNIKTLKDKSHNIFSTSQLITTRLNAYDFSVNPKLSEISEQRKTFIYKKFQKAYHCIKLSATDSDVVIELHGSSTYERNCYRIFELLPFILLENAVKYSPPKGKVSCTFCPDKRIVIKNLEPKPIEKDLNILFEKERRSIVVNKSYDGSGLGLYLAKQICNSHNISINIRIGKDSKFINNVEFAEFKVVLSL